MKIEKGIYRHYKGNFYEVIGEASHSETLEDMVVYRALYGERGLWVRPADMWFNEINLGDTVLTRFAKVSDNDDKILQLKHAMIEYFGADPKRISHFLKVNEFAMIIAKSENLSEKQQFIVDVASVIHDIGIVNAEKKYGYNTGKLQEQEGESETKKMLQSLNFDSDIIDRVCFLVAHHHTFDSVDGIDYRILLEADMLVNLYEDECSQSATLASLKKVFKTKTGTQLCKSMFLGK